MFRPWSILTFLCAAGFFQRSMAPPVKTSIRDSVIYFWIFIGSIYWLTTGAVSAQIALTWQSVLKKNSTSGFDLWSFQTSLCWGILGYFFCCLFCFSSMPTEAVLLFISAGTNTNKRVEFVLKPSGKRKVQIPFYRLTLTFFFLVFFLFLFSFPLPCPSPWCLTVRHLIEGLAASYQ